MTDMKENKKQELIIKISNRTIEVMLEDECDKSFYMLQHYPDDAAFDNMKDMDDFIKFLAKILQIVPKEVGDRITKFAFDAVTEALQKKLQKEILDISKNDDGGTDIAIKKEENAKTEKENEVIKMIAEEDLKARISYIFGDMRYHDLNN